MSLSKPNTCRTDTFMSGRPVTSSVAAVIDPPWPRNARPESVEQSGPDSAATLAKDGSPRNRPRRQPKSFLFQVAKDHASGNPGAPRHAIFADQLGIEAGPGKT